MSMSAIDARRLAMHHKRKRVNAIALTLSLGAMGFGVFWLVWILFETIYLGMGGLNWATFTQMTPPTTPVLVKGSTTLETTSQVVAPRP